MDNNFINNGSDFINNSKQAVIFQQHKRQIQFRAWHDGRMIYPDDEFRVNHSMITSGDILNRFEIIMQHTGLKDSTGEDIYEGDIIKIIDQKGIVAYNAATCSFDFFIGGLDGDNESLYRQIENGFEIELIGNIFHSPELLSQ